MTAFEATVEIVKASMLPGGAATVGSAWYLTDEDQTKKLAACIQILYDKLNSLQKK